MRREDSLARVTTASAAVLQVEMDTYLECLDEKATAGVGDR